MPIERTVIREGDHSIKPQTGKKVTVHYVGKLYGTETVFDSSRARGKPFQFTLGAGEVIAGWEQGVALMSKGEISTIVIPPELGYGKRGAPPVIPPNSTLSFEIELLDCTPRKK
ncbi:putative FKBP-type peptidyl-prolyl cis-trans isomerase [Monocercomonoides exilis]|uniref:putative FKBP-type peptidyl-prolyl cis-trans isomerase n=1 Tax=Monocercomonoides exilis TaxID=2049356 RepID=UPI00355A1D27|nr:putative FKBP-type peptidyl-prolyl cis-trans isomerase [Monocercomonoides exilis]|eukprot:MONOS_7020.1-p1 / transcript=MONOS_7020.1 / gene=MONOS_7020 / organism=Monocercomonoides_exilis_PA203 / gene_product=FKBP-type peptidyl-prolyl cis-trans isomerase / transcript_product=FKBP-type peptidyl-prolyl cis-trans isomerase / location=Mono_scaffold00231:46875-47286(-) / protein_length=113 / sequence_SO=supercontig / SO=protein_coding / is_pseudo=false